MLRERPEDRPDAIDLETNMKNIIDPNDYKRLTSNESMFLLLHYTE